MILLGVEASFHSWLPDGMTLHFILYQAFNWGQYHTEV
jgi:hypothetical protein